VLIAAEHDGRAWTYEYGGTYGIQLIAARPPVGPAWRFTPAPVDGSLTFGVTFPQGGRIDYTFYSPGAPNPVGAVTSRTLRDGSQTVAAWTVEYRPESIYAFERVIDGPGGLQLVYKYAQDAGPTYSPLLLRERQVWDRDRNELLERESRTYTSTDIVERQPSFKRTLLASVILAEIFARI
jgi:hypothetical protein